MTTLKKLSPLATILAVIALIVAVLPASAPASEPAITSTPTLVQDGSRLVAGNGGWASNSGTVDFYVFRFQRDGALVRGAETVPKTQEWGLPALAGSVCTGQPGTCGTYPTDLGVTVLPLTSSDYGHVFCVDVYGGTHSRHVTSTGELAYDVIEFGHLYANDGRPLQWTCLTPVAPAAPPPPPPPAPDTRPRPDAALVVFENATLPTRRAASLYSKWAAANPREAQALEAYDAAVLARRSVRAPQLATAIGRSFVYTDEQAAWDAGVHD